MCFVIQGFGEKIEFSTGKKFNLDASYRIIKQAVEDAGLRCMRADEIQHAGTIDAPMYENLLRADLVIADLSTSNLNAAYELGVRYGLKPRATIVVAEDGLKRPFDVSHMAISHYEHLGKDIGATEAERFRKDLKDLVVEVMGSDNTDSPVYTFLTKLRAPAEGGMLRDSLARFGAAVGLVRAPADPVLEESAKVLMERAHAAMKTSDFALARDLLGAVVRIRPGDDYLCQQLALATYKSNQPTPKEALEAAREILSKLQPDLSNDPETLGLWGAVHKRLWEETAEPAALSTAIDAYERGFYLGSDYYNGINAAFLLNLRSAEAQKAGLLDESITDFVLASRMRASVLAICRSLIEAGEVQDNEKYWVLATAWEAAAGLGDRAEVDRLRALAEAAANDDWMKETTLKQIAKIAPLLADSPLRHLHQH
ncbi:MAG: DUF4071 domain-containing protein [Burkholderiales bacterium]|nr:DUF4071 domain-containing protein [Burkholderiales bacterium]